MGRFYRYIGVVCTLGVLVLSPSTLAAQTGQNFGELVGKVVDDQGGVLPGVTVTLKGPAAMGAPTAVTNDRGMKTAPFSNTIFPSTLR